MTGSFTLSPVVPADEKHVDESPGDEEGKDVKQDDHCAVNSVRCPRLVSLTTVKLAPREPGCEIAAC